LVGVEAKVLGRGGIAAVALATGVSRTTIMAGISEIEAHYCPVKGSKFLQEANSHAG
jgi:hypothetical protein